MTRDGSSGPAFDVAEGTTPAAPPLPAALLSPAAVGGDEPDPWIGLTLGRIGSSPASAGEGSARSSGPSRSGPTRPGPWP